MTKKFVKFYLNGNKVDVVVHTCLPRDSGASKIGSWSRLAWAKSKTLSSK
jgi:hypothetical protein